MLVSSSESSASIDTQYAHLQQQMTKKGFLNFVLDEKKCINFKGCIEHILQSLYTALDSQNEYEQLLRDREGRIEIISEDSEGESEEEMDVDSSNYVSTLQNTSLSLKTPSDEKSSNSLESVRGSVEGHEHWQ